MEYNNSNEENGEKKQNSAHLSVIHPHSLPRVYRPLDEILGWKNTVRAIDMNQILYVHTLDSKDSNWDCFFSSEFLCQSMSFRETSNVGQKLYRLLDVETLEKMLVDEDPLPILMSMKSIICPGCEIL